MRRLNASLKNIAKKTISAKAKQSDVEFICFWRRSKKSPVLPLFGDIVARETPQPFEKDA